VSFFTEIEKINPKIHMEAQKTTNGKSNSEQKEKTLAASQYLSSTYSTKP
jgi:hypothetical protein